MAAEAADNDIMGRIECVCQWQKKLWSSPSTMEGDAHESNNNKGNCARKLDIWTHPSATEEASVLCVDGKGNGSDRGNGYAQSRVNGSRSCEGGVGFACVALVKLFSLVGSIEPTNLAFL